MLLWRISCMLFVLFSPSVTEYLGPKSLGSYEIDKNPSVRFLVQKIGAQGIQKGSHVCYAAENGKSFMWVVRRAHKPDLVGGILISNFPNCLCNQSKTQSADFFLWKTEKGIGLGSPENEILNAYGKPSRQSKIEGTAFNWIIVGEFRRKAISNQKGDKVLVYQGPEDDVRSAFFGIRQGKVAWISLSSNE